MKIKSLDPRIDRLGIDLEPKTEYSPAKEMDQWQTYEVFHQQNRGEQHIHVGIVHAPNADMALLYAKELYARRPKCVNIWVVKTSDVARTQYEDSDMFDPATDKSYRETDAYKNTRSVIEKFKKNNPNLSKYSPELETNDSSDSNTKTKKGKTGDTDKKKPGIVIGKKK